MLPVPVVTDGVDEDTPLKGRGVGCAVYNNYLVITLHNMLPVPVVTDGVDEDTALNGKDVGWAGKTISYPI